MWFRFGAPLATAASMVERERTVVGRSTHRAGGHGYWSIGWSEYREGYDAQKLTAMAPVSMNFGPQNCGALLRTSVQDRGAARMIEVYYDSNGF